MGQPSTDYADQNFTQQTLYSRVSPLDKRNSIEQDDQSSSIAEDPDDTALSLAVQHGRIEATELLLDSGADVNSTCNGVPMLNIAVATDGSTSLVRRLLPRGANLEGREIGCLGTALLSAAERGVTETVLELLKSGANVDKTDRHGDTALMCAARHNAIDTVRALLSYRARTDLRNEEGHTALHLAAGNGSCANASQLLEAGTGIDIVDNNLCTALHLACSEGQVDVAKLLLDRGEAIEAVASRELRPLHIVCRVLAITARARQVIKRDRQGLCVDLDC